MANFNINNLDIKSLIEVRNKYLENKKKKEEEEKNKVERDIEILMERTACENKYDYMRFCWVVDQYVTIYNLICYKICLIEALDNFKGCKDVDGIFNISNNFNTETNIKNQTITITNTETNDFIVFYINYKKSNHIKATALKRFNNDLYKDLLYAKSNYIRIKNKEIEELYKLLYNDWCRSSVYVKDLRGVHKIISGNYHYTNTNLIIDGINKKIINIWDIKMKFIVQFRGGLTEKFRRKILTKIIKLEVKYDETLKKRMKSLNRAINSPECGVCLEKKVLNPETKCCGKELCFECRERIMVPTCPYCRGNIHRHNQ